MNKKRTFTLVTLILLLLSAACAPAKTAETDPGGAQDAPGSVGAAVQPAVYDRYAWDSYSALYQIQFTGSASWTYRLKTRQQGGLTEYDLHMEGISPAQNPGDIRMVTDGVTTWMTGPGTENQCVQFPNGVGMDPQYLTPESLLDVAALNSQIKQTGEEAVAGAATQHYQLQNAAHGSWQNATVDVFAEKDSKMLMLFTFKAKGEDPFFGAGEGEVSAIYATSQPEAQPIAPVTGCEIALPLPESADMVVRLPGMASFQSTEDVAAMQNFYQTALPQEEWAESQPPAQGENALVLSYTRGAQSVEIQIQVMDGGGSKVQMIFLEQ